MRAASLLALAALPPVFSPEPAPSSDPLEAMLSAIALIAVVAGAVRFLRSARTAQDKGGGLLLILAVVASVACAAVFRGPRGPLGRGVLYVAFPLWLGLASVAGAVAGRRSRGAGWKVTVLVAVVGLSLLIPARRWLLSPERMAAEALLKDGDNPTAVGSHIAPALARRDFDAALKQLDQCLAQSPLACGCLAQRSRVDVRLGRAAPAVEEARQAVASCPNDPGARAALVVALYTKGDAIDAEQEAKAALEKRDDARLHYGLALAYVGQGKNAEALAEARVAAARGAGLDASLLVGKLAIEARDYAAAREALAPLTLGDRPDPDALFDMGIVWTALGKYNEAREAYLHTVRVDPGYANARFNLALLTLDHGVVEEAKHHARKFAELQPQDTQRNAFLAQRIAAGPPPRR